MKPEQFQQALLTWFAEYGRNDLPWQHPRTPYRVWVSEIMLQQTQVNTVVRYFQRFIEHFPALENLATASLDDVLLLWAGLGYYARARNLHRTAQIIHQQYGDIFPKDLTTLKTLPGIGRSTAGAILALGYNQPAPILDGNVKRVLSRLHAVTGLLGDTKTLKHLWSLAEYYTPQSEIADQTQAMMDLGALICTPNQPQCNRCPLQTACQAYASGNPMAFPQSKPAKKIPTRTTNMLLLYNQKGALLLEKRPPTGIWGGLWTLPECAEDQDVRNWCQDHLHCQITRIESWPMFRHTFSHFHLEITPVIAQVKKWLPKVMESSDRVWYNLAGIELKGLPAPIKKILDKFKDQQRDRTIKRDSPH